MRFRYLNILIFLSFLLACPSRAQFLGFTSPQTVQATLATNTACTGAAQNFVTSNTALNAVGFRNLGQTQHFATISAANATQLQMEIDGLDNAGTATRISDVLDNAQSAATPTTITGTGGFANIQVKVTCSGAGSTFSLTYSGTSSSFVPNVGGYQIAQVDKAMFQTRAANATQTDTFQPPFANTAGTITFSYFTAGVSGSTIVVSCSGNLLINTTITFSLQNVLTTQSFQVPSQPCTSETVQYVSGGATAGTISMEYIFNTPGNQVPPGFTYSHITTATATSVKNAAGFLHGLTVNTGVVGTISIFDLTAGCTGTPSTNVVAVINVTSTNSLPPFIYDINLLNGICVKASVTAMDITVSYQ